MSKFFLFSEPNLERDRTFKALHADLLRSEGDLEKVLARTNVDSIIIAPEFEVSGKSIVHACLERSGLSTAATALLALKFNELPPLELLSRIFSRVAFPRHVLPAEELMEALAAESRKELIIGGTIQADLGIMELYRGDLEKIFVPLEWFEPSADGIKPDFSRFAIVDYGHSIQLGEYEASTDTILYEFDAEYRKLLKKRRRHDDKSFGASLRRLRLQRGLRQSDFLPNVTERQVGRIERGEIKKPHADTIRTLSKLLRVKPDEIESY